MKLLCIAALLLQEGSGFPSSPAGRRKVLGFPALLLAEGSGFPSSEGSGFLSSPAARRFWVSTTFADCGIFP